MCLILLPDGDFVSLARDKLESSLETKDTAIEELLETLKKEIDSLNKK